MRVLAIILSALLLSRAPAAERKEPIRITENWGVTRLYGNIAPRRIYDPKAADAFEILVEEVPFQEISGQRQSVKSWWGVDGGEPPLVIKRIVFRIAEKVVSIPPAAYVDLGDIAFPARLQLEQRGRELHFFLSGGDAAGSYTAQFIFRDRKLVERRVRPGEFPDHVSIIKFP